MILSEAKAGVYFQVLLIHIVAVAAFLFTDVHWLSRGGLVWIAVVICSYIIPGLYATYIGAYEVLINDYRDRLYSLDDNKFMHRAFYLVFSIIIAPSIYRALPNIITDLNYSFIITVAVTFLFFDIAHFALINVIGEKAKLRIRHKSSEELLMEENQRHREEERRKHNESVRGNPSCHHDWHVYTLGAATEKRRCKNCSRREYKFNGNWILDEW